MFKKKSFTTIELVVTLGIITILFSIIYLNLSETKQKIDLEATIDLLISDIKNQQNKAMAGNIGDSTTHDAYGIYFQSDKYILFSGPNYREKPSNFSINLKEGLSFITPINLPNSQIVFASSSGEIANFDPTKNSIILTENSTNKQKTITINRYGAIVNVE